MLRRLHSEQPEGFAFTDANREWAEKQLKKYPEGREASAIIPLLWRAQEQEGWLSRPAIEHVADMLGMARIRALEVATFYFMFQLRPVGSVAHIQVCGTLSCMLCGAEDLVGVCKEKIAKRAHDLSADGKFSWEEVECLGACANAPMVQIGKDYYEDLTVESFRGILDALARGEVPAPGSYKGRFASEPEGGLTSLMDQKVVHKGNASVEIAAVVGDTIKRIDGQEPLYKVGVVETLPERPQAVEVQAGDFERVGEETERRSDKAKAWPATGSVVEGEPKGSGVDISATPAANAGGDSGGEEPAEAEPELYEAAPEGGGDDLKTIKGVGPKLESTLHELGVYTFAQIAAWGPAEIAWVDNRLNFKGRIERDDWVGQAKALAKGEEPS
ncbi:MAG: NADH-quinone oxidoreductase subunit E [Pseudomonadota bacterium]